MKPEPGDGTIEGYLIFDYENFIVEWIKDLKKKTLNPDTFFHLRGYGYMLAIRYNTMKKIITSNEFSKRQLKKIIKYYEKYEKQSLEESVTKNLMYKLMEIKQ